MTLMRRHRLHKCGSAALSLLLALGMAALARATVVDGNLNDWGISGVNVGGHMIYDAAYPDGYHAGIDLTPTKGVVNLSGQKVYFAMEDSNDCSNDYQVGPLYGGQNFDAEYLGVSVHDGKLWIAVSSGQRPDNGFSCFEPGDIRIKTTSKTYGLEVGGGAGFNGLANGSLLGGSNGSTYHLNSSGFVTSVDNLGSTRPAGSLWLTANDLPNVDNPDWIKGLPESAPGNYKYTQLKGGSLVGNVSYDYNYASSLRQHAWIEASVDLSLLNNETITYVGWAPSCGNDSLYLEVQLQPPPPPVPEPGSLLIWGLLGVLVCAGGWWRRRSRKN